MPFDWTRPSTHSAPVTHAFIDGKPPNQRLYACTGSFIRSWRLLNGKYVESTAIRVFQKENVDRCFPIDHGNFVAFNKNKLTVIYKNEMEKGGTVPPSRFHIPFVGKSKSILAVIPSLGDRPNFFSCSIVTPDEMSREVLEISHETIEIRNYFQACNLLEKRRYSERVLTSEQEPILFEEQTGCLACWEESGNFEYLALNDEQAKCVVAARLTRPKSFVFASANGFISTYELFDDYVVNRVIKHANERFIHSSEPTAIAVSKDDTMMLSGDVSGKVVVSSLLADLAIVPLRDFMSFRRGPISMIQRLQDNTMAIGTRLGYLTMFKCGEEKSRTEWVKRSGWQQPKDPKSQISKVRAVFFNGECEQTKNFAIVVFTNENELIRYVIDNSSTSSLQSIRLKKGSVLGKLESPCEITWHVERMYLGSVVFNCCTSIYLLSHPLKVDDAVACPPLVRFDCPSSCERICAIANGFVAEFECGELVAFQFRSLGWLALHLGLPPVSLFELTAAQMTHDCMLFGGTSDGRVVVWRELPVEPEAVMDEKYQCLGGSTPSDVEKLEEILYDATMIEVTNAYIVHRVGGCGMVGGAMRLLFERPRDPRLFGLSAGGDIFYIVKLPYEADRWQSYVVTCTQQLPEMLTLPANDRVTDIRFWPNLSYQLMAVVESETGPYFMAMLSRRKWPLPRIEGGRKVEGTEKSWEYTLMPSGQVLGVSNNMLCEYLMPEAKLSFVTGRGCLDSNIVAVAHFESLDIVACISKEGQVALFHFDSTTGLTSSKGMAFLPRGTLATCAYSMQLAPTEADMTEWMAFLLIGTADGRIFWVNVTDVHIFGSENSIPLAVRELHQRREKHPIEDFIFLRQMVEDAFSSSEKIDVVIENGGGHVHCQVEWDARKCRLSSKELTRFPRTEDYIKWVNHVYVSSLLNDHYQSQHWIDPLNSAHVFQRFTGRGGSCEKVVCYLREDCDLPLRCFATVDVRWPGLSLVFAGYQNGQISCSVNNVREKLMEEAVKLSLNDVHKTAVQAIGACQAGSYVRLVSVDESQEIVLSLFSISTRKFAIAQRMATSIDRPSHVVVSMGPRRSGRNIQMIITCQWPDVSLVFLGYKNGQISCTVNNFREKLTDDAIKPLFSDVHKTAVLAMGACQAGRNARLVSVDESQEIVLSLFSIASGKFAIAQRMVTSIARPLNVVVSMGARRSGSKQFFVLVVGAGGMESVHLCERRIAKCLDEIR